MPSIHLEGGGGGGGGGGGLLTTMSRTGRL